MSFGRCVIINRCRLRLRSVGAKRRLRLRSVGAESVAFGCAQNARKASPSTSLSRREASPLASLCRREKRRHRLCSECRLSAVEGGILSKADGGRIYTKKSLLIAPINPFSRAISNMERTAWRPFGPKSTEYSLTYKSMCACITASSMAWACWRI